VKTVGSTAFANAGLVYVKWPAAPAGASIDWRGFGSCAKLKWVELPGTLTSIGQNAFYTSATGATAEALELVIVRNASAVPTIDATSFPPAGNNPSLKFYVPDAKEADYKTAANWSDFAAKINKLSDLPTAGQPDNWAVTP
jgi:hypothetical protein